MTERRGAQGRSTIIKRPDGRWHGYVSMGTKGDGTRDRRHVSARTRAEVVVKVRELEGKRDAGSVHAAGKPMKVEEWFTYWVDTIAPARVRPRTLESYRSMIRVAYFAAYRSTSA
jgi:integrase